MRITGGILYNILRKGEGNISKQIFWDEKNINERGHCGRVFSKIIFVHWGGL